MRKIFLFLFAAVLSIGTAMAENIVINNGEFARVDGMWTISGTYGNYTVTVTLSETFDLADPTVVEYVMIDLWDNSADEFAGGGEGVPTCTLDGNNMTLVVDFEDWMTETPSHLEITAELPDPNAVVIDKTHAVEMWNLQVNGSTLVASGKYKEGWNENTYSVELTLASEPVSDGDYVVSAATVTAASGWMGLEVYTFISGTLTRAYSDELGTSVYTGEVLVKDDYNMVTKLELTMYYQAPQVTTVTLESADVEWDYGLVLSKDGHRVALGNDEYEFAYTGEVNEVLSYDELAVYEAPSGDYGYTSEVTMTIDASKKITLTATYVSENENAEYNVTISGQLPTYTVTLLSSVAGATLTGAGEYVIGERVSVTATAPNTAWVFEKWTGTKTSLYAEYDFDADQDYTLTANFHFQVTEDDNTIALNDYNGTTQTVKIARNFSKDKLYTIALPFALNDVATAFGAGTLVYEYNGLSKDANGDLVISFNTVSAIEAGKPYLIIPKKNIMSYTQIKVQDAIISNATTPISYSVDGATVTMTPVMSKLASNGNKYWLAEDTYLYNNNVAVPALRALFTISTTSGMPPRARVALEENTETGVENTIKGENNVIKMIENGQLIIMIDGVKYNVQGVRF